MRRTLSLVLLAAAACVAAPAMAADQGSAAAQSMSDLERNMALGAALEMRAGTEAELGELRLLADRGMSQARGAAAADPAAADAQYALGSWLLYGYRVVEVDQISFSTEGAAETERVTRVLQGTSDDPEEGLAALKEASALAPNNGGYLLDYAAALMDYDRAEEAEGVLKGAWAGQPELPIALKMRTAILLSGIAEANDDLGGAREWVYSALLLDPLAAPAVDRLRELDEAILEAALTWTEPEEPAEEEELETIEGTPSGPEAGEEEYSGTEEEQEVYEEEPSGESGEEPAADEQSSDQGAEQGYQEPAEEYYGEESYQEQPGAGNQGEEGDQPQVGY